MYGYFNIHDKCDSPNRMKDKNYRIISIDADKAVDKINFLTLTLS